MTTEQLLIGGQLLAKTLRTEGHDLMIPANALSRLDELNTILAALDEDRPPANDEEIAVALQADRKNWTWIGKTE